MINPTLYDLQIESYECSKANGFHEPGEDENPVIKLCLAHGELSEALEEYRSNHMDLYYHDGKPEGFGIELADAVIRIMDLAQMQNINLSDMVSLKQAYNRTRSYRHGGKRI